MSWQPWIDFVHGTAHAKYMESPIAADSPATWMFWLGTTDGDMYATSPNFPAITKPDVAKMSNAVAGDMSIFGAPPPPYSFVRCVDCDNGSILTGKDKKTPGRMCYVAKTAHHTLVCLVDIENINSSCEQKALEAFDVGVGAVIGNDV